MKGIILAGGAGTRLYPLTCFTSKQLLPVYDKPMVYYPLSTLMLAGIRDILVISTKTDAPNYKDMLGDGSSFGVSITYKVQPEPDGLARAFYYGKEFVGEEACALVLGDNIFYGSDLEERLKRAVQSAERGRASVFSYYVNDPERFGVVKLDENGNAVSIAEKPKHPDSNFAVTGLYFYPAGVCERAIKVVPSNRKEYEITDLNKMYLNDRLLNVIKLEDGCSWLDTGTTESLYEAASFVRKVQQDKGKLVGSPEVVAFQQGWITQYELLEFARKYCSSDYGMHLRSIALDCPS